MVTQLLCDTVLHYEPAKGVLNKPTASSTQIRKNTNRTAPQIIILFVTLFTFLMMSSHNSPVPNNKPPIMIKSETLQFTSLVNCMARSGINNNVEADAKMIISLLFFITYEFKVCGF